MPRELMSLQNNEYLAELQVDPALDYASRVAIGEDMINAIINRAKAGKSLDGGSFPKYSKDYIESDDFKRAGKSADKVNLTLSSEMLESMKIYADQEGLVKVGYTSNDHPDLIGRVEGNQIGSYGGKPDGDKARPFVGLTQGEKETILSNNQPIITEDGTMDAKFFANLANRLTSQTLLEVLNPSDE
jgi:hypothetical protein